MQVDEAEQVVAVAAGLRNKTCGRSLHRLLLDFSGNKEHFTRFKEYNALHWTVPDVLVQEFLAEAGFLPPAEKRKLLVLVNPASGRGRARQVWAEVRNMLADSGILWEEVVTTHAGHARELAAGLDTVTHAGLVTVSGITVHFHKTRLCTLLYRGRWSTRDTQRALQQVGLVASCCYPAMLL